MNISAIFLNNLTFRIYMLNYAKIDYLVFNLVFVINQTYVMAWFYTNNLDFFDGFFVYLFVSIFSYCYFAGVFPFSIQYRFIISAAIVMASCFVSYFYIFEKKKCFYLNFINESNFKSYRSIVQNMNSGFISIKNSRIVSWNKNIYSHLIKIAQDIDESSNRINFNNNINERDMVKSETNIRNFETMSTSNTKLLLNELFKDIVVEFFNSLIQDEQTDYDRILEFLKNYQNEDMENFVYIGTKAFKNEKDEKMTSYYEIFGRHCDRFKQEKEDNYEFMFNDVSKTKINEEINAEIKYKTIFLSKVAHEFKNPLICVSELIDQVNEDLHSLKLNKSSNLDNSISNNTKLAAKVMDNLLQIKSMCEYLLFLVKDLDFFSLSESKNKIKLEKQKVKLDGVISHSQNITNVLLKKFQKEDDIKFNVDCPRELYHTELFTDEVRVKQLLINLLSNSVKYTFHGHITLKIRKENDEIVFSVIDTGKGLSEEQKTRLNTNSTDNRQLTAYSSSLGFSIIKDIVGLLDSQLVYEELGNTGSKFSFSLKLLSIGEQNSLSSQNSMSSFISEPVTVVQDFCPVSNQDVILKIEDEIKFKPSGKLKSLENLEGIDLLKAEENTDYYLIVDDESFTRKSAIRMLNKYFSSKGQNSRNKVILESSDGIECLYLFYQCMKKGIKLSFIISDQTMSFMNGDSCAKILNEIIKLHNLKHIPFFILTAYENFEYNKECIDKSFTKPLTIIHIQEIFSYYLNNKKSD